MPPPYPSLATILTILCLPIPTHAEDWPQWRGPNRDGSWNETGILTSFPADRLKIRWRAPVGPGWSSPVIAQGRVFLTDSQLKRPQAQERVLCFEEATGKPLWTHSYAVSYPDWAFDSTGRGPTATPIVQDGKVYTVGNKGDLFCLNALNGHVLWKRNLEREYQVQEFAFNASPLIEGNLFILSIGSFPRTTPSSVIGLDKNSGKEVWKTATDGLTNSSPIVLHAGGKRQLIVWSQGSVTSLDPATGKSYWQQQMNTDAGGAVATPVFQRSLLLISGLMLKLDENRPAASILWPETKAVSRRILSNTSTPLLQGHQVFSARSSGHLVCLDARTGKQLWETDKVTDLKGGASIHLTANGDRGFLYTDRGELILAKLTVQGYQEVSRVQLLKPLNPFSGRNVTWSPPAYANRQIFARNERELICASLAAAAHSLQFTRPPGDNGRRHP
jgi:outer membrane protein assembly factor BamB